MKPKKQIPSKPILAIIKEQKERRKEMQARVDSFKEELSQKINRYNVVAQELGGLQERISHLRHLIEMYRVGDSNGLMRIWELEVACGLTKKKYPDWEFDFKETKEGFVFNA